MTLSNSFIIELIRPMGLYLAVKEGSLSGFSNLHRVAIFHAFGIWPSCMEEVINLDK